MYYNTQTHTFGHTHTEVAQTTNSSFAFGTIEVGPYRLYEHAPEPEHDAATHRIELASTATQRTGQPWLRAWDVIALTPVEIEAAQKARVPQTVTRRQARQALLLAGLLDNVQPAIDSIADPVQRSMAQIEWDDSQQFERKRPLLIALAAALGLGEEALDNLFIQAAHL